MKMWAIENLRESRCSVVAMFRDESDAREFAKRFGEDALVEHRDVFTSGDVDLALKIASSDLQFDSIDSVQRAEAIAKMAQRRAA